MASYTENRTSLRSIVVRIFARHARDPGSIPGGDKLFYYFTENQGF